MFFHGVLVILQMKMIVWKNPHVKSRGQRGAEMAGKSKVPMERIEKSILLIREKRVMIDADLASLYGVTTKRLKEQVRRNLDRFPPDFMFELTAEESAEVVANCDHLRKLMFSPYLPFVFTEHGALMLANVLNSPRAVKVSLQIVRTFVHLRELLASNAELSRRLDALEERYDKQFKVVFDAIRQLLQPPEKPKNPIGFRIRESREDYRKQSVTGGRRLKSKSIANQRMR